MEEINEVQAGELITAIKFNEMIEKINKIDEIYLEINKINNMCTEINKNIEILEKKIDMKFTLILAGTFTMGSGINDNSLPIHSPLDLNNAISVSCFSLSFAMSSKRSVSKLFDKS